MQTSSSATRSGRRKFSLGTNSIVLAFLVLSPPLSLQSVGAPGEASQPGTLDQQVDALFAEWDKPDSPGCAVVIVKDGEVVHNRGYGMADLEHGIPITSSSVFDTASVSKQFAGMAVAMLVREGRLSLAHDVRQYLPQLPDFGKTITLRHLTHHTSGLRDWPALFAVAGKSFEDVLSFEEILHLAMRQRDLNFEPGAEHLYSNTGYNLLAKIVEEVTGEPFARWTGEKIFKPLGMTATHFHDNHARLVKNRAHSYRQNSGAFVNVGNQLTALGSSSMFSTTDDMARWLINLQTGRVGGRETLALLRQQAALNDGSPNNYAMGLAITHYKGLKVEQHTGSWAGFRSILAHYPEQKFGIVILGNVASLNTTSLAGKIADLYLAHLLHSDTTSPAQKKPAAFAIPQGDIHRSLETYVGDYQSPELDVTYRIRIEEKDLVLRGPGTTHIRLAGKAPDRFTGNVWFVNEVQFQRDDKNKITGFLINSGRIRNLRFNRISD
jgi:CubicO group peptidase (beta-lactamase class C family)